MFLVAVTCLSNITKQNQIAQIAKSDKVKQRFNEIFNNMTKTNSFIASLVSVINSNKMFANCEADTILGSAMVAASLDLPVNNSLGFAYILPYAGKAQLILGYKAYIQLAIRSGSYKTIHATSVYEDELDHYNYMTGELVFTDKENWKQRESNEIDKIVGYYAYFKLLNGFEKSIYMPKNKIVTHAKKYSKSYSSTSSTNIWKNDFESMALKTVVRQLIRKWGILSIEMQQAVTNDYGAIDADGNTEYIDSSETKVTEVVDVSNLDNMISPDESGDVNS